jgi:hypothetical protein
VGSLARLGVLAALLEILFAAAALGGLRSRLEIALPLALVAFAIYVLAVLEAQRAPATRQAFLLVVVASVLFRATLVGAEPELSDDVYRSLWEGRVIADGRSPYALAPASPELAHLRDPEWRKINNPEIPAIYPPLAQGIAAIAASIAPGVAFLKAVYAAFDLAVAFPLVAWLRLRGRSPLLALVWLWSPLVVVEFAGSGHNDSVAIFFVVLGGWLAARGRTMAAAAALAGCTLAKGFGALVLPLALRGSTLRGTLRAGALFAGILVLGYVPFAAGGKALLTAPFEYATRWSSNSPVYSFLLALSRPLATLFEIEASRIVRVLLAGGLLVAALSARRARRTEGGIAFVITGALLLSPTVHPWYVTWIVPFLALVSFAPALLLSGTCFLAYAALIPWMVSGKWVEESSVQVLEWGPVLLVAVWAALRSPLGKMLRSPLGKMLQSPLGKMLRSPLGKLLRSPFGKLSRRPAYQPPRNVS